jgi:hypothetical protein
MSEQAADSDNGIDLTSLEDSDLDEEEKQELWADRGGHSTPIDIDVDYTLSGNVAYDLVKYVRSNTIRNEQQFLLVTLGYLTGYFTDINHYVSGVLIGTSSSGKTHVQNKVEDLFWDDHMYQATTGSDKSLIYDGDWEDAYIASLDELQKPSDTLIEFLKSVHSDDESFEYKLTPDSAEKREAEEVQTIERTAKPYWFLFAQFDTDFEMWNRLMKVPVHESRTKNLAVGRMAFDEHHITIGDDNEKYGYDFHEGTKALQAHIASIPKAIETGEIPGRVMIPNGSAEFDWKVWDVVKPIFNHSRSESNRTYDMVANVIRASALLNYKNREVKHIDIPNHPSGEYLVAEPQDVANVLAAREALLATTHELDDKKRKICSAIENNTGQGNEADMSTIVDGLEGTDMSMLTRTELRNHLEKLHENYLIEINRDAADQGSGDTYIFNGWGELGFANVYEHEHLFEDTFDPVGGEPFVVAHDELREDLEDTGQDLTKGADTTVESNTGQATLTSGSGRMIDLAPHEEAVRQYAEEALDGVRVSSLDSVPVEGMLGLTDPNDPDRPVDTDGTPLDPTHGCWYQPDRDDDWVESDADARREVKKAIRNLVAKRVIIYDEVHEVNKSNEPVDATFAVLGEQDL